MKQAEIWNVNLNPVKGSEQAGFRPVVILSGNLANEFLRTIIVCPLTTKVKGYKGNPVLEPDIKNGLKEKSEVLVFHIRSISKDRFVNKLGEVFPECMEQMKKTLGDILKY
ncbi:endoribonuclease MazF [Marivirga tractuosa]|uniref:mRNA interferase n=1 Tax=Marivirga tractuosa (strain ATCC 23168 / DSM 4126 / NBRC 15989 / NCIMB 1408 / VKM B-1430 / H-43) TaxID=643867 RepID=E4TP37_MARTH|nr:type II toxin-antitoxin system PemK/MazF family toxin [Marivirga tractuosa]ADR23571.1 transcriptional modulator of MazE/toxin, MazF [Marivirga tractuosa DSM 4126]BDD15750.1 endoribonuclease MazF [Marivirga tractuosa]